MMIRSKLATICWTVGRVVSGLTVRTAVRLVFGAACRPVTRDVDELLLPERGGGGQRDDEQKHAGN